MREAPGLSLAPDPGRRAGVNLQVAPELGPQNLCYPGRRGAVGRLKSHGHPPPATSEHFTPTEPGVGAQLRSLAPEPSSIRVAQSWGLLVPKSEKCHSRKRRGSPGRGREAAPFLLASSCLPSGAQAQHGEQGEQAVPCCWAYLSEATEPECSPPLSPRLWDLGRPRVGLSQPLEGWSGPLDRVRGPLTTGHLPVGRTSAS